MAAVNDITAINNYAGQYSPQIITSVLNGLDVASDLTVVRNLKAPMDLPKYKAGKGFRPYNVNIEEPKTPQGKFGKRTLTPEVGMKILKVIPEELRKTYLSEGLAPNAKEYPAGFAQYFWDEQTKMLQSEINDNCYNGVKASDIPPFDGAAVYAVGDRVLFNEDYYKCITITTAGQSPSTTAAKWEEINNASVADGPGTIIAAEYAGLPARNKIVTGAITSANAYDKVVAFYQAMPEPIKNAGGELKVSRTLYENYLNHMFAKFGNGTSAYEMKNSTGLTTGLSVFSSDGKWVISPKSWMSGSSRIIADVQKKNLYMGTDQTADFTGIGNMVPFLHGYRTIIKMILSFQIADLDVLFVNDQA